MISSIHSKAEKANGRMNSDGSGSIDRAEFLQIPQIATNPLASRMIAIFDQEYEVKSPPFSTFHFVDVTLIVVEERSTFKNS